MKTIPRLHRISFWLLLSVFLTACHSGPSPETKLLTSVANEIILPDLQQFATAAEGLSMEADNFCRAADGESMGQIRKQWQATMQAWEAVSIVQFGPVTQGETAQKLQFWPDVNDQLAGQLATLLTSSVALTPARLKQAGPPVQGLSAVEYLLFDPQGGRLENYQAQANNAGRQCQLLQTIAAQIRLNAGNLFRAWSASGGNYAVAFANANPDHTGFKHRSDGVQALYESLQWAVNTSLTQQLEAPLGKSQANPYLAEAWRSRSSTTLLKARLQAAQRLYTGHGKYGVVDYLKEDRKQRKLADNISEQFEQVLLLAETAPELFSGVGQPSQRANLEQLRTALQDLAKTIDGDLQQAITQRR